MGKTIGVILAGGVGERLGADIPKQFIQINNKMIIEYTTENLSNANKIDEIYIAINPKYEDIGKKLQSKYPKITKIISGGRTRVESIYNGMASIDSNVEKLVFIDAVRPFVKPHIFDDFVELLDQYDAVKFCSPIVDYLVEKENAFIKKVWDRDIMRRCGAPVGYKGSLARKIIEKLDTSEIKKFKSDLEVILYLFPDTKIFIYESTEFNFKITFREDLKIAEKLL